MHQSNLVASDKRPTVFIETHGCKLNQADSQSLANRFVEAGYILVQHPQQADVHVVNTCTVTHVADRKARHALRSARRRNPRALVVATGCYAQRAPDQVAGLDAVDLVCGTAQKDVLVERVGQALEAMKVPCTTGEPIPQETVALARTRAMVKIQEGCDQVCAYCIVPKVRGRERSVHPDALVAQIQQLVAEGYREVVLTGTQLGTYGFDIPGASLARLIQRILEETSIPRLRVSSLQPQEIAPGLLELWRDPRLCPHFHLPLQSGSGTVLKSMRRQYTPQQYLDAVQSIRSLVPGAAITADVIVGFPGETEGLFQETYELCHKVGFAGLHVFPYSARPGTTAAYLESRIDAKDKRLRVKTMLTLAREQARSYRRGLLGTVGSVLWEAGRPTGNAVIWSGLTESYVRVATLSSQPLSNRITRVRLERQQGEVVWGTVAD